MSALPLPFANSLPSPAHPTRRTGAELADVRDRLQRPNVRLVTLTGPGGVGKTRLALQAAFEIENSTPGATVFVSLSLVRDPTLVLPEIARALDLPDAGDRPLGDRLRAVLRDRHLLIVLDNFEQVIGAAADMTELLRTVHTSACSSPAERCSGCKGSMSIRYRRGDSQGPCSSSSTCSKYGAVALFVQQARAAQPNLSLSGENAIAVAAICDRLDGLPLAIELAAVRVRLLSPSEMLARLEQRLSLLDHGARDLPGRQQTMRGAIAWSFDLLTPDEQRLFRRLSVFAGGCTLEAAEVVCTDDEAGALRLSILDGLTSLVEKSLLRHEAHAGSARFIMLETIREFTAGQLEPAATPSGRGSDMPSGAWALLSAQRRKYLSLPPGAAWTGCMRNSTTSERRWVTRSSRETRRPRSGGDRDSLVLVCHRANRRRSRLGPTRGQLRTVVC